MIDTRADSHARQGAVAGEIENGDLTVRAPHEKERSGVVEREAARRRASGQPPLHDDA